MKIRQGALASACAKRLPDPRGADADEHLDEVGPREREERHARLARDRLGQQRLARAGRPDEQDPLGDPAPQRLVLLGRPEELDHLAELGDRLVVARDVVERHAALVLLINLGLALGKGHRRAHPSRPPQEDPEGRRS